MTGANDLFGPADGVVVEIAEVVLDIDSAEVADTYTYRVAEEHLAATVVGAMVRVPFGSRRTTGIIVGRSRIPLDPGEAARLRETGAPIPGSLPVTAQAIELARWVADRWVSRLNDAMRLIAPEILQARPVTRIRITQDGRTALRDDSLLARSARQSAALHAIDRLGERADLDVLRRRTQIPSISDAVRALERRGFIEVSEDVRPPKVRPLSQSAVRLMQGAAAEVKISLAGMKVVRALEAAAEDGRPMVARPDLLVAADVSPGVLKTLQSQGVIEVVDQPIERQPIRLTGARTTAPPLTPSQREACGRIAEGIRTGGKILLHGVTASGKTEVYLDAISRTLAMGRRALVLVPEIALTTQVVEVFAGRFGRDVAVLHSALSDGERHDEWHRARSGNARIVVGARSAVFAPVQDLGLIVLDEEHEGSYKQANSPRYHAREVAEQRARADHALLLMGSATPSIETYYAAQAGRIGLVQLHERVPGRAMPTVEVVDQREEFKTNRSLFSSRLADAMQETLAAGQQAILFLNRRGFAQFMLCRECGFVLKCPNCAVSLTLHGTKGSARCHHCDHVERAPDTCPSCRGSRLRGFGVGTERVEQEVAVCFPSARVIRMDRDTTSRKDAHQEILSAVQRREVDILIGTQMVVKGLDFPNVTLVGVISADTAFNMPDFRASETAFQQLTQVAGRAGRGEAPGRVILQTFNPEHCSVQHAIPQDYEAFYQVELANRRELGYPPFSRLANALVSDPDEVQARTQAGRVAEAIRAIAPVDFAVYGPLPAPLARLRNEYRYHTVVRGPVDTDMAAVMTAALATLEKADRRAVMVDIDPLTMM